MIKILSLGLGVCSLFLAGCASLNTSITASGDVNADINGNPSAIAMSVFELTEPYAFQAADFINLYTAPQKALGASLLWQETLMLAPGETTTLSLPIKPGVFYLGYVAAYRNLNTATWKIIAPVHPNAITGENLKVMVSAEGLAVQN